eukprot:UN03612
MVKMGVTSRTTEIRIHNISYCKLICGVEYTDPNEDDSDVVEKAKKIITRVNQKDYDPAEDSKDLEIALVLANEAKYLSGKKGKYVPERKFGGSTEIIYISSSQDDAYNEWINHCKNVETSFNNSRDVTAD